MPSRHESITRDIEIMKICVKTLGCLPKTLKLITSLGRCQVIHFFFAIAVGHML
jgi:hypothetical protein